MQTTTDTSAGETINGDLLCVNCGYNLRTLRVHGLCPECGMAVAESVPTVSEYALWLGKLDTWSKALLISLGLFLFGVVAALLQGVFDVLATLASVVCFLAAFVSAVSGTTPGASRPPNTAGHEWTSLAARWTPAAFLISFVLPVLANDGWLYLTVLIFLAWIILITEQLRRRSLELRAERLARSLIAPLLGGFILPAATIAHGVLDWMIEHGWIGAIHPDAMGLVLLIGVGAGAIMYLLALGMIIEFRGVVKKAMTRAESARSDGPAN